LHGKNVYLDTCYCRGVKTMGKDEVLRIIKEHGSDKVLFSSDYPMADPKEEHEWLSSLPLSAEEKDNIFWRNAKKLFGV
ncbi:MAG: amidohydrolase family protein, partial [Chloroflexi bacterium]|nr:amidohydrolase family protein [Chloroflexota bacterium]